MTTQLYRERQLWSGNESVEIRYVNGSFVAGTSASSPGVPRHMYLGWRASDFMFDHVLTALALASVSQN